MSESKQKHTTKESNYMPIQKPYSENEKNVTETNMYDIIPFVTTSYAVSMSYSLTGWRLFNY